jgi:hypothetical protein
MKKWARILLVILIIWVILEMQFPPREVDCNNRESADCGAYKNSQWAFA